MVNGKQIIYSLSGPILVGASGFEERALHLLRQCEDSPWYTLK